MVIVTDVHYKMALALIRDCGQAGLYVVACENGDAVKGSKPIGFYSKYVRKSVVLSGLSSPQSYLNELYELCSACKDGDKPVLIPVGAKTLALLSQKENYDRFCAVAYMCIPRENQLALFNNKELVGALARKVGVPTPESYENCADFGKVELPCIVKPICGEKLGLKAAERYAIVSTAEQLAVKFEHFKALEGTAPIVQQYIKGDGCGISVLAKNGKIIDSICHVRLREYPVTGGPSTCCLAQEMPILADYAGKIIKEAEYTGVAMLEFKRSAAGNFYLLEINPRVWGSYPLTRAAKSNFSCNWVATAKNVSALPAFSYIRDKKMQYFPQDILAGIAYAKRGRTSQLFGALGAFFSPRCSDGVLEWRDFKASFMYLISLFKK